MHPPFAKSQHFLNTPITIQFFVPDSINLYILSPHKLQNTLALYDHICSYWRNGFSGTMTLQWNAQQISYKSKNRNTKENTNSLFMYSTTSICNDFTPTKYGKWSKTNTIKSSRLTQMSLVFAMIFGNRSDTRRTFSCALDEQRTNWNILKF